MRGVPEVIHQLALSAMEDAAAIGPLCDCLRDYGYEHLAAHFNSHRNIGGPFRYCASMQALIDMKFNYHSSWWCRDEDIGCLAELESMLGTNNEP